MLRTLLHALILFGIMMLAVGCDSPSSKSSQADKAVIKAQDSKIQVLTNKLSEQETLNKSLKSEIQTLNAKYVDLSNKTVTIKNSIWLPIGMIFIFLLYLYMDKRYCRFGRR